MSKAEIQTPGKRVRRARTALGKTLESFGAPMERSRAAISRWETDQISLTALEAGAMEHFHGISAAWILRGEEPIWVPATLAPLDDAETEYRPVIPGAASCGPGGEIADPGPSAYRLPFRKDFLQELLRECGGGTAADCYVVECTGESMRPTLHPGDLVLINTALELRVEPERDALYLVRTDPTSVDARIKRVHVKDDRICFASDASGFKTIAINVDGIPIQRLILGRVCWIARSVVKDERPERNW